MCDVCWDSEALLPILPFLPRCYVQAHPWFALTGLARNPPRIASGGNVVTLEGLVRLLGNLHLVALPTQPRIVVGSRLSCLASSGVNDSSPWPLALDHQTRKANFAPP